MNMSADDKAMPFAQFALKQLPTILALQDRTPHSLTRGCFDPNYWQHRLTEFAHGGRQELVWPLALAYVLDIPGSPYFRNSTLRNHVEAGIRFAAASSHADGSCDARFPQERSRIATARSLLACVEASELIGLNQLEVTDFFYRRADWLCRQRRGGKSGSEQALVALALLRCDQLTRSSRWLHAADRMLSDLLAWQSPEGWFPENQGLDPGLHSYSIWLLAQLRAARPDERLDRALQLATRLAADLVHPDGSTGGEYGSVGSPLFFAHGFELLDDLDSAALSINTRFAAALENGAYPASTDNSLAGQELTSMLLTWRDWRKNRPPCTEPPAPARKWLPDAGLLIERRGHSSLYVGMRRGGSFRLYREGHLVHLDTQLFVQIHGGRRLRAAACNVQGRHEVQMGDDAVRVRGQASWLDQRPISSMRALLIRLNLITLSRLFPSAVKGVALRLLARRERRAPLHFERNFKWLEHDRLLVEDRITAEDWAQVVSAGSRASPAQARALHTYAAEQLAGWEDLTAYAIRLGPNEALRLEREF